MGSTNLRMVYLHQSFRGLTSRSSRSRGQEAEKRFREVAEAYEVTTLGIGFDSWSVAGCAFHGCKPFYQWYSPLMVVTSHGY